MTPFKKGILAVLLIEAIAAAIIYFIVLPRLDWGADQAPPQLEMLLVDPVISGYMKRHATSETNPLSATPENLKEARGEFQEHCAPCHGLDGTGPNLFGAQFYPPVPNLADDAPYFTDGELYLVVKKGFASTGMPAFGGNHSPEDLWRMVLWVRHLGQLTPAEKSELKKQSETEAP